MRSIRSYLTTTLLTGLLVLLVLSMAVLYLFVHQRIVSQFDGALHGKARAFAGMIEQDPEGIEVEIRDEFVPEFDQEENAEYYQLWVEGGETIDRSPSLENGELPRKTGPMDEPYFWNMELPDGREGRAVGISFRPYVDEEEEEAGSIEKIATLQLVLAVSREEMSKTLFILLLGSLSAILVIGLGTLIIVMRTTRKGLEPLDALADDVSSIDSRELDRRFGTDNLPNELLPIVRRLNELLERLEVAFSRERRLTSDMAHELKTPVAELRSMTEVALRWPDDRRLSLEALNNALEIADQMNTKISVLLQLARCEAGKQSVSSSDVPVNDLLADLWRPWEKRAAEKGIRAGFDLCDNGRLVTDRTLFSTILSNLFDNAVEYTPADGNFRCTTQCGNSGFTLRMVNSNDSLTREDLPHIFEQLWRKEAARSDGAHLGLGLTLVQAYAGLLGIEINTTLLESNEFSIELAFPGENSGGQVSV
jgi:two-component system sensor histidine kinase QseC